MVVWQNPHGPARRACRCRCRRWREEDSYSFPSGWRAGGRRRPGSEAREADGVGYGFRRKATRGSTFQAGHHGRHTHTPTWLAGCTGAGRASARAPPRPRGTGKAARPRTETGKPSGGRPNRIGIYRIASSRTVAFARIVELAQTMEMARGLAFAGSIRQSLDGNKCHRIVQDYR